jgi:hypothetical protein
MKHTMWGGRRMIDGWPEPVEDVSFKPSSLSEIWILDQLRKVAILLQFHEVPWATLGSHETSKLGLERA